MKVRRPALRYYGGKWRLASWITNELPPHSTYVEPYGGAASVLLRKPKSAFEVYNDLDCQVVNFFRVCRERGNELMRAIELTPYSRREYYDCAEPAECPIENARRFFVKSWQGYGGPRADNKTGWKFRRNKWVSGRADQIDEWRSAAELSRTVDRLREVQIECDDALHVIARYDSASTLFYIDPPYPAMTRSTRWSKAYKHELSIFDHELLIETLRRIRGLALISSYPNELYDRLGWKRLTKKTQTFRGGGMLATEALYVSPRAQRVLEKAA
ncbi:MAG TPA: DNA adenine methylase [Chthoniobacterales bacterium]|jgi:DNA adenine methylase|nr:DNA adenine methylase [Chthoniobacterales bacterium]